MAAVHPLSASIEILPRQVLTSHRLADWLPAGTRVYLADIGTPETEADMQQAARRLQDIGCVPVPHLAARRIESRDALEKRLGCFAEQAGMEDVLVIGGGAELPIGPYASTMALLETGLLDRFGIKYIAVAGHPEGSSDFTEASAIAALRQKQAFAERTDARLRIVTQFGFDPERAVSWAEGLANNGINTPVHLGVAGPAELATLIRYARLCGVSNALSMLKKNAGSAISLGAGHSPETFVTAIEEKVAAQMRPTISQVHVFPFGGLEKAASWLRKRGSW